MTMNSCLLKDKGPELTALGLPWFPVRRDKSPLSAWKQWQHNAPPQHILQFWFRQFPFALCGVPTGSRTIIVIDADSLEATRYLWQRGIPRTVATETRKGVHYWFRAPDIEVRNSASEIADKIDARGEGGFAIAWPWLPAYSPREVELANLPQWLLDHFARKAEQRQELPPAPAIPFTGSISAYARKAFDGNINRLIDAKNGTRNQTLIEVACRMGNLIAGGELDQSTVIRSVMAIASSWKDEPASKSYDTLIRGIEHGKLRPASGASSCGK